MDKLIAGGLGALVSITAVVLGAWLVGLEYPVRPSEVRFCASSSPAQPSCSWP